MLTTTSALTPLCKVSLAGTALLSALALTACDPNDLRDVLGGGAPVADGGRSADGGESTSPCAATLCRAGTRCEVRPVQCVKAPCPGMAVCVEIPSLRCGGIAGFACPGHASCVDDPGDSCDPKAGGADCGGICQCKAGSSCATGLVFDSSPQVCDCVKAPAPTCPPVCTIFCEYGNVLDGNGCATCKCNPPPPDAVDPCATVRCAAGTHCEAKKVECVKAPCNPIAQCVADVPTVSCGGFAGRPCPGAGKCVDDPKDSCDPAKGGADCGGICQCVQNVFCARDMIFDSSPKVCACVAPTPPPSACGSVCGIYCEYGNVLDAKGCPTCSCKAQNAAPACPAEKCTGAMPKSANYLCADGSTAGPSCRVKADGSCAWAVLSCPQ